MKKLIYILMLVLLCGCTAAVQSNPKYNMEKVEDYFPVMREELGKDICIYSSYDTYEVYTDKDKGIIEYRVDYSSQNSYYIYRVKKADSFEDITEDMDIVWENKTDAVEGSLSGFKGNGTVSLEYFGVENQPFEGEVWFDSVDKMVYAAIIVGYSDELTAVKTVFTPGYFTPMDFETYEEAEGFIVNYHNEIFCRDEGNGQSYMHRDNDIIYMFTGDQDNYIDKMFYPDGVVQIWTKTTDPETGNFKETTENIGLDDVYTEAEWTKDLQCIYSYGENKVTGYSSETKYDLTGNVVYERHNGVDTIEETYYDGMYGTHKIYYKNDQYESNITFKTRMVDGYRRRYYLTVDNKHVSKVYTYLSEDSLTYAKFEALNKADGELVVWYFDGNGNTTDNIVKLERTVNGVTTTYSHAEVPWGTGMIYPPKNPGQFYF